MVSASLTVFFKEIDKGDIALVGGKGANLGEMTKAGFPVPNGFAVTVHAYDLFLEENRLKSWIQTQIKSINKNDTGQLQDISLKIQRKINAGNIPESIAKEVYSSYKKLSGLFRSSLVAVRSSATAEDLPGASFAGQQATFLNVRGEASLLVKIRECWASLFTPRAIFYRNENKIDEEKVKISVIVQKMIQSEVSGVMFTIDPVTNEKDKIVIEAVWGLGEMIVQGSVVPDKYVVQKDTFQILSKEISDQAIQLIKVGGQTKEVGVKKVQREKQKISNEEIIILAKIAENLQKHYYFPQDIEWAKEGKNLYIVQTRPVTTTTSSVKTKNLKTFDKDLKVSIVPVLKGTPASPGIVTGEVKILKSPREISKVQSGDVLVAPMTSPDYVPAMRKAVAVVTDKGGQTSHAAIVSRELGIAAVVGTVNATTILKEGITVTVNGGTGEVFLGGQVRIEKTKEPEELPTKSKTATKVYVNLGEPQRAKEVAKMNVDGVGLLRAEFMIANIGIHPKQAIKEKKQDKFVEKLASDLSTFCKEFYPRPVVYRATDFKTNEYRSLKGGKTWEPEEPNPMLGFRGAYRYLANPDVFTLELTAIKKVREKYSNLWLMIPFVRSPQELARVRRSVAVEGLFEKNSFKFWMMVEIPVNVIMIEDFLKVGIDGVSIGSNDLTMLMLGTDRDNSEVANAFDELSPAVSWSIKRVIKTCRLHKVSVSICGQAPSTHEDLVEDLVRWGVTSVSVNPDAINRVRNVILEVEKKVVTKG